LHDPLSTVGRLATIEAQPALDLGPAPDFMFRRAEKKAGRPADHD
jgi:hypothetical protein